MEFTPIEGWMCLKCGRTQCAVTPSGMLVVCVFCPWEECIPCNLYVPSNEKKQNELGRFHNLDLKWDQSEEVHTIQEQLKQLQGRLSRLT